MPKITIAAARVNAGFTQKQFAERLNVAESTVRNWENGRTYPKQPDIERICEVVGLPYDCINFCGAKNFA